ncbi:MAG: methyltransferase domain-containing protein [Candidatus Eremiobacterota bacterium]
MEKNILSASSEVSIDEIMKKVKEEVRRRKHNIESAGNNGVLHDTGITLYTMSDFQENNDGEFINHAYRKILRRDPDNEGFSHYLTNLKSGILSKKDIIYDLACSEEGKKNNIVILNQLDNLSSSPDLIYLTGFKTKEDYTFKDEYILSDFLKYNYEDFIKYSFSAILKKEPSIEEINRYLYLLQSGTASKIRVIEELRYSREGIEKNVTILGLGKRHFFNEIFNIPLLGRMLEILSLIIRLPRIFRYIQRINDSITEIHTELTNSINTLAAESETQINHLIKTEHNTIKELSYNIDRNIVDKIKHILNNKASGYEIEAIRDILYSKADTNTVEEIKKTFMSNTCAGEIEKIKENEEEIREILNRKADADVLNEIKNIMNTKADAGALNEVKNIINTKADSNSIEEITREIKNIANQIRDNKLNILDQQRRLMLLLEEARKRLPETINRTQIQNMLAEEDHILDAMYVSFEDRFRGTRDDIKNRQKIYLPYMEQVKGGTASILDIGCGRGEWLELLRENGYIAKGLDVNRIMVQECLKRGLDVEEADAIEYVKSQNSNSFDVITGFHIVEHLPLKILISLFDETLRILKPGGLVIFETPNPENIIVGACSFYTDPTHINPLPPHTLKFLLEARGFTALEIKKANPLNLIDYDYIIKEDGLKNILFRFNMEQDYSVIAVKH